MLVNVRNVFRLSIGVCVVVSQIAEPLAQPIPEDDPPPAEHDTTETDAAPLPGEESGRVDREEGDSTARRAARGVLILPKLVIKAVLAPIRGGIWAYDRYHPQHHFVEVFFNKERTIGLYPTLFLESGYGLNLGGRFVHRDLFGEREYVSLRAATGGRYRTIAAAKLKSGNRFGSIGFELHGLYEQRPHDVFYGIGNANSGVIVVPATNELVEARYRERVLRTAVISDIRVARDLHVRASGAIADFTFDRSDRGPPIDEVYTMETMVGWGGFQHSYSELELRYDTRRRTEPWEDAGTRSAGWFLSGWGARVTAIGDGADYWRGGVDLQRFIRLGIGPRVLQARLYGEAVSASLDEVPFTQLPRLGGSTLLRGYAGDRFRDRASAIASLEYTWDLSRRFSASTYVDAGRVFPSLADVSVDDPRVGYGVSFEGRGARSYLFRINLASSIDGGLFLDLAFDSVYDLDPRVERR